MPEEFDDVLVTYDDGMTEDSVHLSADHEFDWDLFWRDKVREKHGKFYADKCEVVAIRFSDGEVVNYD